MLSSKYSKHNHQLNSNHPLNNLLPDVKECKIKHDSDVPTCLRIEGGKITTPFPGQIKDSNTYRWIDSGGSGKIYIKNSGDRILKLIISYPDETFDSFKDRTTKEIEKQNYVAQYGLAPKPEYAVFVLSSNRIINAKFAAIMEMDYLSDNKWPEDIPEKVCEYIVKLAEIGLVNKTDPMRHFYFNEDKVLQMIDYGEVTEINTDSPEGLFHDMSLMAELCGIHCNFDEETVRNIYNKLKPTNMNVEIGGAKSKRSKRSKRYKRSKRSKRYKRSKRSKRSKKTEK